MSIINLMDSGGVGLICETEADTVSTAIGGDHGHWSDLLRKCFDHDRLEMCIRDSPLSHCTGWRADRHQPARPENRIAGNHPSSVHYLSLIHISHLLYNKADHNWHTKCILPSRTKWFPPVPCFFWYVRQQLHLLPSGKMEISIIRFNQFLHNWFSYEFFTLNHI